MHTKLRSLMLVVSMFLVAGWANAAIPNFYPKHAYEDTFVFVAKHAL